MLALSSFLLFTGCGRQKADILLEEEQNGEEESREPEITQPEITQPEITKAPADIFVDVCGAVTAPGVYRMPPESRVFQAVEAAGGFLPEAAGASINQAQPLSDGQQVYVPTKEEAEGAASGALTEPGGNGEQETGEPGKVNLNTADAAALQTLSGIGEAKAQAILAYREEHGGFASAEELMNVPGIKENTFSNIKDKIAVE